VSCEERNISVVRVLAGTEPTLSDILRHWRVMQDAQRGHGAVELVLKEGWRQLKVDRESAMKTAAELPRGVKVGEHGLTKPRKLRPDIPPAKGFIRENLRIAGVEIEADVERLL